MTQDTQWNETDWRTFATGDLPPILTAALNCFVEHGYHGTSTRVLAAAAGLSVPGLYHHYASKHDILVDLMQRAMRDLYHRSLAATADTPQGRERFIRHIECLTLFHAHRQQLAFIAASEIRSLSPEARGRHISSRDQQQALLEEIVTQGVRSGDFVVDDVKSTTRALITMCTGVAEWYRLDRGPLNPDQLAERYTAIALRAVGCTDSTAPHSSL